MLPPSSYAKKLLKSFDLILNHTIDNRDDTITLKLVDQLAHVLKDRDLYDTVATYIRTTVLTDQFDLTNKEPEQQLFCLNLLKCLIQIKHNPSLESSAQDLILTFLNDQFYCIDSGILCSLIDLVSQLNELNESIRLKMFNIDSISHFLDPDLKSVFVRNNFKSLLVKYLHEPALVKLVQSLSESIKLHNLDVFHTSGLILEDLESKWQFVDLKSIKHYSYMIAYGVESEAVLAEIALKFESRDQHDLAQKFLLYSFESFKGCKEMLLQRFFAPFKLRHAQLDAVFKYFVHNLKIFVKFNSSNFNMSDYVSASDVFYLLKSFSLKSKLKKHVLECLIDYFEVKNTDASFLSQINQGVQEIFYFKLDGELSIEFLKLAALGSCQVLEKVDFKALNLGDLQVYVDLSRYMLKLMSVKCLEELLSRCLTVLCETHDADAKDSILALFNDLSSYDTLLFNDQVMEKILLLCLAESEALLRREYLKFLSKFYSLNPNEYIGEFFCYFLLYEHDWQCQLYCIDYFDTVLEDLMRQKDGHIAAICASLATSLDDADQHVVKASCQILTKIKLNFDFGSVMQSLEEPRSGLVSRLKQELKWIAVGCEESVLSYNLEKFNGTSLDLLEEKLSISSQSSDLYAMNDAAILDDIISAYQFDWDDQKALDCY
ncbi:hypothetical protein BpHYR1_038074 [Brachionus plicatilis]|uniref:Uncharacterized protein n=1 Tax=Brachionus plicatilis TaxID=10195 RepID=A0A3M7RZA8_BRAPC|nr:hypothetical protein BpHYR1_038074 [Brachionus plicatilis]